MNPVSYRMLSPVAINNKNASSFSFQGMQNRQAFNNVIHFSAKPDHQTTRQWVNNFLNNLFFRISNMFIKKDLIMSTEQALATIKKKEDIEKLRVAKYRSEQELKDKTISNFYYLLHISPKSEKLKAFLNNPKESKIIPTLLKDYEHANRIPLERALSHQPSPNWLSIAILLDGHKQKREWDTLLKWLSNPPEGNHKITNLQKTVLKTRQSLVDYCRNNSNAPSVLKEFRQVAWKLQSRIDGYPGEHSQKPGGLSANYYKGLVNPWWWDKQSAETNLVTTINPDWKK